MKKNIDLHVVYKNEGETPLEVINRFKYKRSEYNSSSITYAGRLDPMAEGLILLLTNEEVKNKDKYLDMRKTYKFSILWGFSTDTLDVLGLVGKTSEVVPQINALKDYIEKSKGVFEQTYPVYSSKPVNGKPLFMWAREGRLDEIQVPKHVVEIYSANYVGREHVSYENVFNNIKNRIEKVNGDFRQKNIIDKWEDVLVNTSQDSLTIDTFEIEVSSGFYVRQFVSDIASHFNTKATTFCINRTKIGEFGIADCIQL